MVKCVSVLSLTNNLLEAFLDEMVLKIFLFEFVTINMKQHKDKLRALENKSISEKAADGTVNSRYSNKTSVLNQR